MGDAEAILAAVRRIHEAPITADGWTRALPSIAAALGSQLVNFHVDDATGRAVEGLATYGIDPEHLARFRAAGDAGILPRWWRTVPAGRPTRTSAMWSDQELMRLPFYNEVVRPTGSFLGLHTALTCAGQRAHLIAARALGRADYAAEDVAAMQMLVPHLLTALRVGRRLAATNLRAAGACAALDRLGTGVMLVDAKGRILFANRVAESLLAAAHGLDTESEGLCARDPQATRALLRLIAGCTDTARPNGGAGGLVVVPCGDAGASVCVVVAPFRPEGMELEAGWLSSARPVAILFVGEPEQDRPLRKEALRHRFGLTPAEADLALEVAKGDGRQAAAARLGISLATARTHLERIFEKTGARRQAELVRIVLRGCGNSTSIEN